MHRGPDSELWAYVAFRTSEGRNRGCPARASMLRISRWISAPGQPPPASTQTWPMSKTNESTPNFTPSARCRKTKRTPIVATPTDVLALFYQCIATHAPSSWHVHGCICNCLVAPPSIHSPRLRLNYAMRHLLRPAPLHILHTTSSISPGIDCSVKTPLVSSASSSPFQRVCSLKAYPQRACPQRATRPGRGTCPRKPLAEAATSWAAQRML